MILLYDTTHYGQPNYHEAMIHELITCTIYQLICTILIAENTLLTFPSPISVLEECQPNGKQHAFFMFVSARKIQSSPR
jgi:hypothetical protein